MALRLLERGLRCTQSKLCRSRCTLCPGRCQIAITTAITSAVNKATTTSSFRCAGFLSLIAYLLPVFIADRKLVGLRHNVALCKLVHSQATGLYNADFQEKPDAEGSAGTNTTLLILAVSIEAHVTHGDNGNDYKHMREHITLILLCSIG
jgi:hypothetical protein